MRWGCLAIYRADFNPAINPAKIEYSFRQIRHHIHLPGCFVKAHMPTDAELQGGRLDRPRVYRPPSEAAKQTIRAAKYRTAASQPENGQHILWQTGAVDRECKETMLRQSGCVIWFTGLSGSGKSTVAIRLEHALAKKGYLTTLLDGDNVRHGLNSNLTFSREDRAENIRRIGEVSKLMAETGVITLTSFISPYARDRQNVRSRMGSGRDFIEVFMDIPLEVCEARDCKGLYKLAREGKILQFTGIDDPYEEPINPEIVLHHAGPDGTEISPDDMAAIVLDYLQDNGYMPH